MWVTIRWDSTAEWFFDSYTSSQKKNAYDLNMPKKQYVHDARVTNSMEMKNDDE